MWISIILNICQFFGYVVLIYLVFYYRHQYLEEKKVAEEWFQKYCRYGSPEDRAKRIILTTSKKKGNIYDYVDD